MKKKNILLIVVVCFCVVFCPKMVNAGEFAKEVLNEDNVTQQLHGLGIIDSTSSLPVRVDLSKSGYFPTIKKQHFDSCVPFANTYLQFSYEANRLNRNTKGNVSYKEFSPYYVFNYLNNNKNLGVVCDNVYKFLNERGCIRASEFYDAQIDSYKPLTMPPLSFLTKYCNNAVAKREALNLKVESWYQIQGDLTNSKIVKDRINAIKRLLAEGYVVTAETNCENMCYRRLKKYEVPDYYGVSSGYYYDTTDEFMVYWVGDTGAHQVAIVGYDDDILCDLNMNQCGEEGERGAFKVINTNYQTGGVEEIDATKYFWISYDALYKVSKMPILYPDLLNLSDYAEDFYNYDKNAVGSAKAKFSTPDEVLQDYGDLPRNWDTVCSTFHGRKCVRSSALKNFNFIKVKNSNNSVLAEVTYTLSNRSAYSIYLKKDNKTKSYLSMKNGTSSITTTEVFDFEELMSYDSKLTKLLGKQIWEVVLTPSSGATVSNLTYKLTDDLGKIITQKTYNVSSNKAVTLQLQTNLMLGDLDYNGTISTGDCNCLYNYLYKGGTLSTLQKRLSDYNFDGKINSTDYKLICNAVQ